MAEEPLKVNEKPVEKADHTAHTPADAKKKTSSTTKIVLIVVGVVVGLAILGTIASMVLFGALLDKATESVDVNNGEVTVKSDDGQSTTTYGDNVKLADGFPTDVPIFDPSTLKASSKNSTDDFSAVATTAQPVAEVTSFYKTEMAAQGWTTQYDSTGEGSSLLTFAKGNRTASVIVSTSTEADSAEKTGFVISVSTVQE